MERVLGELKGKICFVYVDDIIVFSRTQEQHLWDLEAVLQKLHQANLTLNGNKCHLHQNQLTFLRHMFSWSGVDVDPEKIKVIAACPVPTDLKSLQRFLRMVGWYHKFIPPHAQQPQEEGGSLGTVSAVSVCFRTPQGSTALAASPGSTTSTSKIPGALRLTGHGTGGGLGSNGG